MKKLIFLALSCILLTSCTSTSLISTQELASTASSTITPTIAFTTTLAAPTKTLAPTFFPTLTPAPTLTPTPKSESWHLSNFLVTFNDMAVVSETEIWVIGQNGIIIHSKPKIAHLDRSYDYPGEYNFDGGGYLSAIDFISNNDGWMTAHGGQIFHWNGKTWTTSMPFSFDYVWSDIGFANHNIGWVIGCDRAGEKDVPLIQEWNGNSWQNIPLSDDIENDYCLTNMDIVSENDVWVIGNNYIHCILLHWNGLQWQEFQTPAFRNGTAVGAVSTGQVWVLAGDRIYYWNGSKWTDTELPVDFYYSESDAQPAVLALSQNNVWVGGRALYHWDGIMWKNADYDEKYGYIVAIKDDPDGEIWALTISGAVLRLTDQ